MLKIIKAAAVTAAVAVGVADAFGTRCGASALQQQQQQQAKRRFPEATEMPDNLKVQTPKRTTRRGWGVREEKGVDHEKEGWGQEEEGGPTRRTTTRTTRMTGRREDWDVRTREERGRLAPCVRGPS